MFAALTSVLGKLGVDGISGDLANAIRCTVVLFMAWIIVFTTTSHPLKTKINVRSLVYITLSGIATGASWLCYYRALFLGPASVVAPIDKLSIVFTVILSYLFFKEKLSKKSLFGLLLIVSGTLLLLLC